MPTEAATGTAPAAEQQPPTPGLSLRSQREHKGYSKQEIANQLHITVHYVTALENDAYDRLPAMVFARGYIERYGEILDLDTDELLERFADLQQAAQTYHPEVTGKRRRKSRMRKPNLMWLVLLVALLAGFWVWNAVSSL